jgi:glycosyltransferase involved in cell wall biosynthesis
MIVRLVNGCVSIGSENAKYYEWLGARSDRIFFAPFSVANNMFDLGSAYADARRTERLSLDIAPDAKVVLFASKLIARKRTEDLLAAMDMVSARHRDAVLLIAGTGPEEPRLRELAAGRSARIVFAGFRNQSEMPALMAASDIFVLPSEEEPWGLIVNEAMAAGLPVIVSDDVGAAPDLVEGKGTGLVFPARDVAGLADALDTLLGAPHMCREMGSMAKELIERWDVKASADGIGAAARAVVRRG